MNAQPAPSEHLQRLELLYRENSRVATVFWDWRHKTFTIFSGGAAALGAIEAWLYSNDLQRALAIPAMIGALLALVCVGLEVRSTQILGQTYRLGAELEQKIADGLSLQSGSVFRWLAGTPRTSGRILSLIYISVGIGLLPLASYLAFRPL